MIDRFSYLVIPGFYDANETGEMISRARELLKEFDPSGHPLVSPDELLVASEALLRSRRPSKPVTIMSETTISSIQTIKSVLWNRARLQG